MLNHAVIAGTFDHLHKGHQKLLTTALKSAKAISCGLTSNNLTKNKSLSSLIQPSQTRLQALNHFFSDYPNSINIFPLTHPLRPAITSAKFDSIIASTTTQTTVNQINQLRLKNHLKPLKPIIIDLIKSSDNQSLSSTRIRQGQINRQGYAYHQVFPKKTLHLPPIHRQSLRRPFDTLLTGSQNHLGWASLKAKKILDKYPPFSTIAVGDIAVTSLLNQKLHLNLAIVDLKTNRQPIFKNLSQLGLNSLSHLTAPNPPSTITPSLITSLNQSLDQSLVFPQSTQTILVKGEEDLAVLPAILLSPLNTAIFYGQPNQGLVHIRVTESSKQKALNLLQKFT